MQQGRILILGQTKENSYEIRNLLDSNQFELEIALNKEVGKLILSSRRMGLLIIHTEAISEDISEFFEFLDEKAISIPMLVLGEDAGELRHNIPVDEEVPCFEKPYPVEELMRCIQSI